MNIRGDRKGQALRDNIETLAAEVVDRQYRAQPGVWDRFGAEGRARSVRDARYHLTYLAEALDFEAQELFVHYAGWVKSVFAGIRLPDDTLPTTLAVLCEVIRDLLPSERSAAACAFIQAALAALPDAPVEIPSCLPTEAPFADIANRYLQYLRAGDRRSAGKLILEQVQRGMIVRDISLHVFQPVLREVGRLWQMNLLSVAQEHFCTAATQCIMAQLYPFVFGTEKTDRRMVAACIGGELHEIGIRMVADLFEMQGWETYYLGANTPASSIVETVSRQKPDVVCLSATIAMHLEQVAEVTALIRQAVREKCPKILVGGYPFIVSPSLWRRVDADGSAADAPATIALAEKLAA